MNPVKQVPRIYTDDELTAAARRVNELRNQLLLEFRPVQAEAYASYCEREALVEAAEAGRGANPEAGASLRVAPGTVHQLNESRRWHAKKAPIRDLDLTGYAPTSTPHTTSPHVEPNVFRFSEETTHKEIQIEFLRKDRLLRVERQTIPNVRVIHLTTPDGATAVELRATAPEDLYLICSLAQTDVRNELLAVLQDGTAIVTTENLTVPPGDDL